MARASSREGTLFAGCLLGGTGKDVTIPPPPSLQGEREKTSVCPPSASGRGPGGRIGSHRPKRVRNEGASGGVYPRRDKPGGVYPRRDKPGGSPNLMLSERSYPVRETGPFKGQDRFPGPAHHLLDISCGFFRLAACVSAGTSPLIINKKRGIEMVEPV